ncbi:unnamed protein product [Camellia sinensis]
MKTGYQLRRLFCIILTQCFPLQPHALWNQFSMHICDDLAHKLRTLFAISNPTEAQIEDYGLYLLNQMLEESGKSLIDFPPMPQPTANWSATVGNRLIFEHQQLHNEAQQTDVQITIDRLNNGQRTACNAITSSVFESKGTIFFLNGGAGTGKTFLYNTIALKCRSLGHIVVAVASSGIASLLLVGGRTAHSTFSIPLDVLENSVCGFSKQSLQAELFREAKLIIWDEVPMQHRHYVEAVDRTLRDICDCEKPFGGITVVLGGDFRQILPVITKGVREQIVNASLRHSVLWKDLHVLSLDLNMRLNHANLGNAIFAKFLTEVGTNPQEIIKIPSTIHRCQNLKELLSAVYPQLDVADTSTPSFLTERNTYTYLAADKMAEDDEIDPSITNRYSNEFLNSLDPPGLPAFKVELKVGCPIMLLRNIAPKDGLCNGTRLMVSRCDSRIIEARILTGEKFGNLAFIPRISLTPSSAEMPFRMTRRQFPVRLANWLIDCKGIATKVKNANLSPAFQIKDSGANRECPKCHYRIDNSDVSHEWPGFPAGVKFDPSDVEILEHLAAKCGVGNSKPHMFIDEFIPTVDKEGGICYTHPENLPGVKIDGSSVHFFHRTINAYATGRRKRRRIQNQHIRWHKTGKTKPVMENGVQKGCKKIMVLYKTSKRGSKPDKSNWVMHQYHLGTDEDEIEGQFVVSKIFSQPQKQIDNSVKSHVVEDFDMGTIQTSPRTPKTNTPNPPRPGKSFSCDDMIDDYAPQSSAQQEAEFATETSHPSSSTPHFKDELETQTWLAGESQALDGNGVDDSLLCNEIFSSYSALSGLNHGPFSDVARFTNDVPVGDRNPSCGIADLENLDLGTPPDFQLADLQFGSQESILGWLDHLSSNE